jgi:hypothetical protein
VTAAMAAFRRLVFDGAGFGDNVSDLARIDSWPNIICRRSDSSRPARGFTGIAREITAK